MWDQYILSLYSWPYFSIMSERTCGVTAEGKAGGAEKQWKRRQHKDLLLRRKRSQTLERGLGSFPQLVSGQSAVSFIDCDHSSRGGEAATGSHLTATGKVVANSSSLSFYPHCHLSVLSALPSELSDAPDEPRNPLAVWYSVSAGPWFMPEIYNFA